MSRVPKHNSAITGDNYRYRARGGDRPIVTAGDRYPEGAQSAFLDVTALIAAVLLGMLLFVLT
jgi:hypothetical protein